MTSFKQKYPAFAALLALAAAVAQDFAAPGLSLLQKLSGLAAIIPQVVGFLPLVGSIGSEIVAIKAAGVVDIEAAAELLVTDLAFSSDKAKAIVASAFPVAEQLAGLFAPVQSLIAAIKA